MYGRIGSAWKVDGKGLTYSAIIPANTTATLYLPATAANSVKEAGKSASESKGVTFIRCENGKAVDSLASGSYEFTADR